MAFLPVINVVDTPLDGKSIKVVDATGTVGVAGNTTGYGQTVLPQTAPVIYGFLSRLLTAIDWTSNVFVKTADAPAIQSSGHTLTSLVLAGLSDFPDGVTIGHMLPYTPITGVYTLSPDKKTITLPSAVALSYVNDGYTHVCFLNAGVPVGLNIAIDTAATVINNSTTQLVLKSEAPATGYSLHIAKPAIFRFLELAAGNKCIVRSIAGLTEDNVEENSKETAICKLIQWQLSGKINFSCKDYAQAHDTIVSLNLKCGAGCTSC